MPGKRQLIRGEVGQGLTFTGYALHSPVVTAFNGGDDDPAAERAFTVDFQEMRYMRSRTTHAAGIHLSSSSTKY